MHGLKYIFAACIDSRTDTCIGPPTPAVNIMKNIESSSIVVQWDAVNDSLTTVYVIQWTRDRGDLILTEQTSYTITGLTLDTVYTITVSAANTCGGAPAEFSTIVTLSTDATSSSTPSTSPTVTASTNSMSISIATTSSTIVTVTANPMPISTAANTTTAALINPTTKQFTDTVFFSTSPVKTNVANENSKFKAQLLYAYMPICIGGML